MVREMAPLWHSGDSILLLAETVAALPWLKTYIDDINYDDELLSQITDIDTIYILNDDLAQLNEQARANLDLSQVSVINDMQWVHLTQSVDRVITLNSLS